MQIVCIHLTLSSPAFHNLLLWVRYWGLAQVSSSFSSLGPQLIRLFYRMRVFRWNVCKLIHNNGMQCAVWCTVHCGFQNKILAVCSDTFFNRLCFTCFGLPGTVPKPTYKLQINDVDVCNFIFCTVVVFAADSSDSRSSPGATLFFSSR